MKHADISVIIPTHNRAAWLPKCLAHLEQQTFPAGRFEVLVVDDGSTDDTRSVVERYASGAPVCIRYLPQDPKGLVAAQNFGANEAIGESLLFIGDDELVSPRLLEQHAAVRKRDTCTMGDVHRHPQLPRNTFTRLLLAREAPSDRSYETKQFLEWPRSNFCLDRSVFFDVGGFSRDPNLAAAAPLELAHRLGKSGMALQFIPDARVYVWQPTTFATERRRQYRLGHGLMHLQRVTRASSIPAQFRLQRTRAERMISALTIPFYVRTCQRQEESENMIINQLYKRVLYHDRVSGYEDACQGRAFRLPVPEEDIPDLAPQNQGRKHGASPKE